MVVFKNFLEVIIVVVILKKQITNLFLDLPNTINLIAVVIIESTVIIGIAKVQLILKFLRQLSIHLDFMLVIASMIAIAVAIATTPVTSAVISAVGFPATTAIAST